MIILDVTRKRGKLDLSNENPKSDLRSNVVSPITPEFSIGTLICGG